MHRQMPSIQRIWFGPGWFGTRRSVIQLNVRGCTPLESVSFSIIFQLRRSESHKNAANPAFFELDCKLPKLRTWVRFPSPAPDLICSSRGEKEHELVSGLSVRLNHGVEGWISGASSHLNDLARLEGSQCDQCRRDVRTDIIDVVRNWADYQDGEITPAQILLVRDVLINRNQNVEPFFRLAEKLPIFFAGESGLARRLALMTLHR